jgi:hypothetical protein
MFSKNGSCQEISAKFSKLHGAKCLGNANFCLATIIINKFSKSTSARLLNGTRKRDKYL